MEKKLPKDWQWIKLKEICEVVTGTTPPKSDMSNYGKEIPFFKPPHLWDGLISVTDEMLSLKGATKARVVPPNTVLVTCIGNLGRTGFVKKESAFNQQINAILENDKIYGKYIFYQAQSPEFRNQLEKLATGTTVSIVNKGNFETINIPLAPKETQQAIVSKIEELFSELDKGIEDLKTAQLQLKTYRQSVLKFAFEGRLTEEWRKKINKDELDKAYWETINTKKYNNSFEIIIPKCWVALPVGNVCEFQQGMQIAKNTRLNSQTEGCLPILRIKNYKDSFKTDVEYIKIDENSLIAEKEDIIMTRTGESRGNILTGFKGVFHNNTFRINYSESHLNREYLIYYLSSTKIQNFIKENSGRTGQPDLTHRNFGPCPLAIPSLEEQNQIVQELESRLSVADKMEESIAHSLLQAESLRQSILKKAFSGELV